jgi:hypothetical protein
MIPKDLLADIDELIGPQDRNSFLVEVLQKEVNRRRLLQFLSSPEPLLKDEDYPEFREGSENFVRGLRQQDKERDERVLGAWLPRAE